MTYIGDVITTQMRKLRVTKDMILANTMIEEEDLDLLIKNRLPAEVMLYYDIKSLCDYLKIA